MCIWCMKSVLGALGFWGPKAIAYLCLMGKSAPAQIISIGCFWTTEVCVFFLSLRLPGVYIWLTWAAKWYREEILLGKTPLFIKELCGELVKYMLSLFTAYTSHKNERENSENSNIYLPWGCSKIVWLSFMYGQKHSELRSYFEMYRPKWGWVWLNYHFWVIYPFNDVIACKKFDCPAKL